MLELTSAEVVALFDVDPTRVYKDVEYEVIECATPARFRLAEIVYFYAYANMRFELGVKDRKRIYRTIALALRDENPPAQLELSSVLLMPLCEVVQTVRGRLDRFEAWKRKLVQRDDVLGGEPVFPKSRLSVRHVGDMVLRGAPIADLREDYPQLTEEDLEFAKTFAIAYPRRGRPRVSEAAPR